MGHVDFYPNGGSDQPGCSLLDLPVDINSMVDNPDRTADSVSRHLVACSHTRAIDFYIESLNTEQECMMIGHECASYEEFEMVRFFFIRLANRETGRGLDFQGMCFVCGKNNQHCAMMGYRSIEYKRIVDKYDRKHVKFYLDTSKGPKSYCRKKQQNDIVPISRF